MLSALSPSSLSNAANNSHPSVDAPSIKSASSAMVDHSNSNNTSNTSSSNSNGNSSPHQNHYLESGRGAASGMDYSSESSSSSMSAPVHPLATSSSSSSSPSLSSRPLPQQLRPQTPTNGSTPTFQHQQLVKIKSEHGLITPHPQHQQQQQQQLCAPDIVMTDEDGDEDEDEAGQDSEQPTPSPLLPSAEAMDEDEEGDARGAYSPGGQEKTPLMVDTSSGALHPHSGSSRGGTQMSMASPNMIATPSTATLTPDSGATSSSSRRPSLRTMTATLPRSALQEETIALFKQYRNLIPCAKCFSRNTIQRDGMSDGNLRFKCRPPVSMSLICNKSYSESKIRNMIAGVVYGHSLPESNTPTSATSSENVLALALPPSLTKSGSGRRPSHKYADASLTPDMQQPHSFQDGHHNHNQDRKAEERGEQHQDRQEMDDDRGGRPGSRRPSSAMLHPHPRRPSIIGQESPMIDYEESTMMGPPSGHLQVPNTPPLDGEDPRTYRPHSAYGHRPLTPVGVPPPPSASSNSSNPASRQGSGALKLHHSHSHPNIGQQRHQQYLDQQRHGQQQQQQQQPSRQVIRIEPAQPHHGGSEFSRPELAERRFSHPAALQRSPSNKYLPVAPSNTALSSALSSSSQSSPRYESVQQPASSAGPGGRYEEIHAQGSYYQRRMSQPHPSSQQQRSYGQLPPPPPPAGSNHRYDRRASEVDEYNYQHLRQYERLNASTMRGGQLKAKIAPKQYSPPRSSSLQHTDSSSMLAQQRDGPGAYPGKTGYPPSSSPLMNSNVRPSLPETMRLSHSMSSTDAPGSTAAPSATSNGGRHAYQTSHQQAQSSSIYYHQPSSRDDLGLRESYAHDGTHGDMSPEDADGRLYARMRQGFRKSAPGQAIRRLGSSPNLYTTSMSSSLASQSSAKDLNSAPSRNSIKLTCFPSAVTTTTTASAKDSNSATADASDEALDVKMSQSSKVVIEITQPRGLHPFELSRTSSLSGFDDVPRPLLASGHPSHRTLRHTVSQPNLLVRNTSSVLERRRRSISPSQGGLDDDRFGSSKKRRADSLSRDEDASSSLSSGAMASASVAAAEAAAAAVVAAAANAARQNSSAKKEVVGLGVVMDNSEDAVGSPTIDALDVARTSSYVSLEDQKELGIDYSLFTRVETAAWRILIPPNVTASFRSEDFGLTLKPKALTAAPLASALSATSPTNVVAGGCEEIMPLVAPMAAITTKEKMYDENEREEEKEEKDMIESREYKADEAEEGDHGMDVIMETEEELTTTMNTATTATTTTTTATTMETHDTAAEPREEEMMDQVEDD